MKFIFLLTLFFAFSSSHLYALCTAPAGVAGQLQWITPASKLEWCDGTSWIDSTISVKLSCSGTPAGTTLFAGGSDLQYCDGTFWQTMKGVSTGMCMGYLPGYMTFDVTTSTMKFCDGVNWNVMYNASTPVMGSLSLNAGAPTTKNNFLSVALSANNSVDGHSQVSQFCLKYSADTTIPSAPTSSDSCWIPVNNPSPGIVPAISISFSAFYFPVGYTPATYAVFAWVKNSAGLMSSLSAAGAGTAGVDKASITYNPSAPPAVINVASTSSNAPTSPPSQADLTIPVGGDVYIKWNASGAGGFGATPITLYYTTDDTNYIQFATNVSNSANAGCTVDGVSYTGCYKWTAGSPTSSYYKIRVAATDLSSLTTFSSGSANNMSTFKVLAGNTDPGLGSSASSAMIFDFVDNMSTDAKSFVVTPDGKFFIRDRVRGILWVDPADGKLKSFIPLTGTSTDGAIGTATLRDGAARMTLDFQGRLLIWDVDKIRRVDLTTNQVSTIVGGGTATTSGSPALSMALSCSSSAGVSCPMTPLPNGDIYFFRTGGSGLVSSGASIWKYTAADGKVYAMNPGGTGASSYPTLNISTSLLTHFAIDFNTTTSVINKFYAQFWQQPCVGCGMAMYPAELNQTTWQSLGTGYVLNPVAGASPHPTVTAMDGQIYVIPDYNTRGLWRYNRVGDTWTKLLGGSSTGSCVDGTLATSCNVYLQDAFISALGQIFFVDNGLIRTVDGSNQVKTLFGQRKTFGDGGLATSARFNSIYSLDMSSTTGKIAILDFTENVLREFTAGGNINKIVGDGTTNATVSGSAGAGQPIVGGYWGNQYQIYYDSSNDDIFFTAAQNTIMKYQRISGNVLNVAGGGGTSYQSADGLAGLSMAFDGYPPQIIGFDGSKIIVSENQWNGSAHFKNFWKFYDKNISFTQSQFAGNLNITPGAYSADGSAVSTADVPLAFGNNNLRGYWSASNSTWYFGQNGATFIKSLPIVGNIGTLANLPRGYNSWTLTTNASAQQVVYYCSGGRLYKYNVALLTETALPWPASSISCTGYAMVRSATRNSIIFPFSQNGLIGVAEIVDTP